MGNWSADELSDKQISFAARIVMAVLDIFCSIYANKFAIASILLPIVTFWSLEIEKFLYLLGVLLLLNTETNIKVSSIHY